MSEGLADGEREFVEQLMTPLLDGLIPQLEEAVGTGLDPTSILVGSFIVLFTLRGERHRLNDFLARNQEVLVALRGLVA